jgi:NADPH-dependent ferric siderophore reductase
MIRVRFAGDELAGFVVDEPAASVRLLLPSADESGPVVPVWNGNEFLRADGRRPILRTFTPRYVDTDARQIDLDIVAHGPGCASEWAARAEPGDRAAISGPGRGYTIDATAPAFSLAGDETAIPAISQLLEAIPAGIPVRVDVEIGHPDARLALGERGGVSVHWWELPAGEKPGEVLVEAVRGADLRAGIRVWAAGEAAAMQRLRRHLFEERALARAQCTVRGYWKHGRAGDTD